MSTPSNNNSSGFNGIAKSFGYVAFIALILFAAWVIGNKQIEKIVTREQTQVSDVIIKTINEQAQLDLFMPQMVFINVDSIHKKQLNDSIKKQIASALIKRYNSQDKSSPGKVSFQPFFIYPDSVDKKGNYTLTKTQLEELKNHIAFLSQKVDQAVSVIKDEMGREIDRLNTWVSIWIGVIGFLGIFVPIVINVRSSDELNEINKKADNAEAKVVEVKGFITKHEKTIENLKGLPADLEALKKSFKDFEGEVKKAKEDAIKAVANAENAIKVATKSDKLVTALNDLGKIKDIDANYLIHNSRPLATLKTYLVEIHTSLNNGAELFDVPIMRDIFRQLAVRLHLLAPYSFISPANFDLINNFVVQLSQILTQPLTQETYNQALQLLNTLNTNLITEQ